MDREELAHLDYCHVTTTGRTTGRPHTIEIWFALHEDTAYLLSGGRDGSDWVRNIRANPTIGFRLGDRDLITKARIVEEGSEEDELVRRLLVEKYSDRTEGDLSEWGRTALPIAIDVSAFSGLEAAADAPP